MTIIEEYSDVLQKLSELRDSLTVKESELNLFKIGLSKTAENLKELENLLVADEAERVKSAIARAKEGVQYSWNTKISSKENEIKTAKKSCSNSVEKIKEEIDTLSEDEEAMKYLLDYSYDLFPEKIPTKFYLDKVSEPSNVTREEIEHYVQRVANYLIKINKLNNPIVNKFIEFLSGSTIFCNINNPKIAVLVMTLYLGVLSTFIVGIPEVSLFIYTGAVISSAITLLKKYNYHQLKLIDDAKLYKMLKVFLKEQHKLKTNVAKEKIHEMVQESKTACSKLLEELDEFKNQMSSEIDAQDKRADDPEFIENCNKEINIKIGEVRKKIEKDNEELNEKEEDYQVNNDNLKTLTERKETLKQQIIDTYITSLVPGDLVTVAHRLFLGFNEDDDTLVSIEDISKSNIILYSEGLDNIYSLVTAIIIQLFRTYDVTNMSLTISDISSSGTRFNMFKTGKISDVVDIITLEDDVERCGIKVLYSKMINKNIRIASRASSIEEFNELMHAQNSLPETFDFFISIDSGSKIFTTTMTKLIKEGPLSGVYPLIFLDYQKFRDILAQGKPDVRELENFQKVLVPQADWYSYIPSRAQFVKMGSQQTDSIIKSLEQKILAHKKERG